MNNVKQINNPLSNYTDWPNASQNHTQLFIVHYLNNRDTHWCLCEIKIPYDALLMFEDKDIVGIQRGMCNAGFMQTL